MILVTGATGNFGGHVADLLISKGKKIAVASGSKDKLESRFDGKATLRPFNWSDTSTFQSALEGIDVVYLIAPPFSEGFDKVVESFLPVAKNQAVRHIVLTTAYGMDQAVGSSGYKCEQLVKESGIEYTILRPNFIMQNFINYDLQTIQNGQVFYPTGDGTTSYIDIRDVAEVSVEVLLNNDKFKNEALVLTGSEALSHGEMAKTLSEELKKEIHYTDPSEEEFKKTMAEWGVPAQVYEFMGMLYAGIKAGYMGEVTQTFHEVTGHAPRTFRAFVKENTTVFKG